MKLRDFELECFFGKYEFTAPYLLAQSDCESMTAGELLALEEGSEKGYLDQWLGYTETWGDPELREHIAALYGPDIAAENVLTLHGAQEGIFLLLNTLLDAGDHVIVMYPNYPSVEEIAAAIPGVSCSRWELQDCGERWGLDLDALEGLIRPETRLLCVNSPNNPTGFTLTDAELDRIAAVCRARGLYLFCDEVYKGLELDGHPRSWGADRYEKALSLGVMSKAYGLAGLRVGWFASRDRELLDRMVRMKHYTTICDAAPSEYLSKIALRHSDALLARSREIIRRNLLTADKFFARHRNVFEQKAIDAGPIAFHKLLLPMPAGEFCDLAVEKKGVLLLPGRVYGTDGPYFRMGYGRRSFPENLAKLEEFLEEQGF